MQQVAPGFFGGWERVTVCGSFESNRRERVPKVGAGPLLMLVKAPLESAGLARQGSVEGG